jgi:hypothetical protein
VIVTVIDELSFSEGDVCCFFLVSGESVLNARIVEVFPTGILITSREYLFKSISFVEISTFDKVTSLK